jgi:hypothetical protein
MLADARDWDGDEGEELHVDERTRVASFVKWDSFH